MKKIVSLFGDENESYERLNKRAAEYARGFGYDYAYRPKFERNSAELARELKEADVGIIGIEPYGEEIFKEIHNRTKLLVRFGVGFDAVDLKKAREYGIAVARTTNSNKEAVAEMALMLMLNCRRVLFKSERCLKEGRWEKDVGNEIVGSTVGILGFGSIGRMLAVLLSGFSCNILVYDPSLSAEEARELNVNSCDLDTIFKTADAISIHMPYKKETHNIIDKKRLSMMKESAVLVNTARGNLVNEDDLYEALSQGKIRAAGFDVFATEPLPKNAKLRELDNIVLTPHVSSQTEEAIWNTYKMAIDIIKEVDETGSSTHILN